jgi:hypothetical protein
LRVIAFEPSSLAAGLGAVWAADYRWPVLVRIDPAARRGELFASFPADDSTAAAAGPDWQPGPAAIAIGGDAVWLALPDPGELLWVDPGRREVYSVDLPFEPSEIGAGPAGVFVIGPPGDGRLAAVSTAGTVTLAPVGHSPRLLAVAQRLVWTVDDAAGTVIALDSESLTPVATFRHLASPYALLARGDCAWYICGREMAGYLADGRQERGIILVDGRFVTDLLRLDAATGEMTRLGQLDGHTALLDGDGFWVCGRPDDPMFPAGDGDGDDDDACELDPVTALHYYDLAGRLLRSISVAGQADQLAVHGGQLWVNGFRRSRQADVLSLLNQDGTLAGEADLTGVDVTPWYTPPEPDPQYPPREFAELARAVTEASLTEPHEVSGRFGDRWQEPPVSPAFSLDRVELRSSPDGYEITVTFRWAGEDGLLGFASLVGHEDDWPSTPAEAGGAVCIYLEENLKASGHGLATAIREPRDGVIWLRWA